MVLGEEHVPDAELFGTVFQSIEDGWMAVPSTITLTLLGSVDGVGGNAFFFYEFLDLWEETC